jgi:predicted dehydrogenase
MHRMEPSVTRRDFMKSAVAVGATLGGAKNIMPQPGAQAAAGRIIGANDKINVAVIGVGSRGSFDAGTVVKVGETSGAKLVAVCDVYERRKRTVAERRKCDGYSDYREVLARSDVDAVVVATPDHWHARIALEAMDSGKDVYVEKPMTHTIAEAKELVAKAKEKKRIIQVGSQTTSATHWHLTRKYIADGAIGPMVMSQGSYHRNSPRGEWNYRIDPNAGPDAKGDDHIDWEMWLGSAPRRPFDADRFFRFRKYWDYSGGIATDLFFHIVAPLNICWPMPEFPAKVTSSGGIYGGPASEEKREVPDTFHVLAEFPSKHSLVLSSTMANSRHIPGMIRGRLGTIIMVDNGMFEDSHNDHITLAPERAEIDDAYRVKFGDKEIVIPVEDTLDKVDALHMSNFLSCIRSRRNPTLDVETAYHVQVTISMSVQAYREGRVLYWDAQKQEVVPAPPLV